MSRGTYRDNERTPLRPGADPPRPAVTEIGPKGRPRASAGIPSCDRRFALRPRRLRGDGRLQEALKDEFLVRGVELEEAAEVEREAIEVAKESALFVLRCGRPSEASAVAINGE